MKARSSVSGSGKKIGCATGFRASVSSHPPSVDFLTLHALVQARTVTCKTMFFGEDSIAASAYVSIPAEDYCRPLKRYPQLAAVLYPLGAIDMYTAADIPPGIHIPAEGGY